METGVAHSKVNVHLFPPATVLCIKDGIEICKLPENQNHHLFTIVELDRERDLLIFRGHDRKRYMCTKRLCSILTFINNKVSGWEFVSAGLSHVLWTETGAGVHSWHFKMASNEPFSHFNV